MTVTLNNREINYYVLYLIEFPLPQKYMLHHKTKEGSALSIQSWAPTMEKVSDNRHQQSIANTRQPTPDNQEPTTTTDSDNHQSRVSTVNTRQVTLDNQKLTLTNTTNIYANKQNTRQQIIGKRKCLNSPILTEFFENRSDNR